MSLRGVGKCGLRRLDGRWRTRAGSAFGRIGVLHRPIRWRCPVRVPREVSQVEATITTFLPDLRPAHRLGLALWVYGAVLAGSACQVAVLAALLPLRGGAHALRKRLREGCTPGRTRPPPVASTSTWGGVL